MIHQHRFGALLLVYIALAVSVSPCKSIHDNFGASSFYQTGRYAHSFAFGWVNQSTTRRLRSMRKLNHMNNKKKYRHSPSMSFAHHTTNNDSDVSRLTKNILSTDPKVFTVPNFLTPEECQAYINRAKSISSNSGDGSDRKMIKSNPPEVSLSLSKLWPLSIFCILAGVPPVLRLLASSVDPPTTISIQDILLVSLPNIGIATALAAALTVLTLQVIRRTSFASSRTSEALALNCIDDVAFIQPLVDRACAIIVDDDIPTYSWQCFEAPVVTRYGPGAIFARHNDASPTRGSEWSDLGGQRIVTVIVYLTTVRVEGGGATAFDRLNLSVQPSGGTALVFYPADQETLEADERTRHESQRTCTTGVTAADGGENEKDRKSVV